MLLNYITTFESVAHEIRRVEAAHGETFKLTATITTAGQKQDLSKYTVIAIYQKDADVGVSNIYNLLDVVIRDGKAVVYWDDSNEIEGVNDYKIWLLVLKNGEITYPAMWDLFLAQSPGDDPILTPSPETSSSFITANVVFSNALAPFFSPDETYLPGTLVSNFGWIWITKTEHSGDWNDDDFIQTTISDAFLPITGGTLSGNLTVPQLTVSISDGSATLLHDYETGWKFIINESSSSYDIVFPKSSGTLVINEDLASVAFSGNYSDLNDKPNLEVYAEKSSLASVAFSGNYDDLNGKPTIPKPQVNADWDASSGVAEIKNKPDLSIFVESSNLASVAFSGNYGDLNGKPTIPEPQVNADWNASSGMAEILNKPDLNIYAEKSSLASVATTGSYNDLKDKPTIPSPQVNADWNASSGVAEILNKPDLGIYAEKSSLASVAFSGEYSDLSGTPDLNVYAEKSSLASVAFSGEYGDLKNTPSIPEPQVNADWNASSGVAEIKNKPDLSIFVEESSLASVAFSGNYGDLKNKPNLDVYAEKSSLASVATTGSYTDLQNTPTIPIVVDVGSGASSGQAADAASVWNLIGDIEEVLYFINYGSSSGGEA